MRIAKKRCAYCHQWFPPDSRTTANQKFCSAPECRKQSSLEAHRQWWSKNGKEQDEGRADKHKVWARDTGYWRDYRAGHPDYVQRDKKRRQKAKEKAHRAANQDMRREFSVNEVRDTPAKKAANQDMSRQISVGKLRDIQALRPQNIAPQDPCHRRLDRVVEFLLWKERAANQDLIGSTVSSA